jgi:hypothetical protein
MTDESPTQPDQPKKSWLRKIVTSTWTVIVGPVVAAVVGAIILHRLLPSPADQPTPVIPSPTTTTTTTRAATPAPEADPPLENIVPPEDSPITVSPPIRVKQCDQVILASGVVVDGTTTTFTLNVAGKTDTPVTLTGIEVSVSKRVKPTGNYLNCQGTGEIVSFFGVDLDRSPPPVVFQPGRGANHALGPALDFPMHVTVKDPQTIEVEASTYGYDCTWTMGLEWTVDGHTHTYLVDDHGAPFRTISTGKAS